MRRSARVRTNERTGASSYSSRIASAQARISSPLFVSPNSLASEGKKLRKPALVTGVVASDLGGAVVDQVADAAFDLVSDLPHLLDRLSSRVIDGPVLNTADHIRATALAVQRDRLIRVELHLEFDSLRPASGDIDANLAHCLDYVIIEYLLVRYAVFLKYCMNKNKEIDPQDIKDYIVAFSRIIGNNTEAVKEFFRDGFGRGCFGNWIFVFYNFILIIK